MSWVYDSLKGNHSSIQAVFNNPLVSASRIGPSISAKTFDSHNNKDDDSDDEGGDEFTFSVAATTPETDSSPVTTTEEQLAVGPSSPNSEKRRMGSNRGMKVAKTKRTPSNGTLDSIKAILSPATTRRRSLVPFESLKTQTYIP